MMFGAAKGIEEKEMARLIEVGLIIKVIRSVQELDPQFPVFFEPGQDLNPDLVKMVRVRIL